MRDNELIQKIPTLKRYDHTEYIQFRMDPLPKLNSENDNIGFGQTLVETKEDLKGTMDAFLKAVYGQDLKTRFRPSYFPFVAQP